MDRGPHVAPPREEDGVIRGAEDPRVPEGADKGRAEGRRGKPVRIRCDDEADGDQGPRRRQGHGGAPAQPGQERVQRMVQNGESGMAGNPQGDRGVREGRTELRTGRGAAGGHPEQGQGRPADGGEGEHRRADQNPPLPGQKLSEDGGGTHVLPINSAGPGERGDGEEQVGAPAVDGVKGEGPEHVQMVRVDSEQGPERAPIGGGGGQRHGTGRKVRDEEEEQQEHRPGRMVRAHARGAAAHGGQPEGSLVGAVRSGRGLHRNTGGGGKQKVLQQGGGSGRQGLGTKEGGREKPLATQITTLVTRATAVAIRGATRAIWQNVGSGPEDPGREASRRGAQAAVGGRAPLAGGGGGGQRALRKEAVESSERSKSKSG